MYGQWEILETETKLEFGYNSTELTIHSHKPIIVKCRECGIKGIKRLSESTRKHRCKSVIDGLKYCFRCKRKLSVDEFSKNRRQFDGYQKVCKACFASYPCVKRGYKKSGIKRKTDLETTLLAKESGIRQRTKHINVPCDLPRGYLKELFDKQNGKCFYSGIDISISAGVSSPTSISVDRLNPRLGYTVGNIVLCANSINNCKFTMTVDEFKTFLKTTLPGLIEWANS
jgi:hypothetical protein